MDDITRSFDGPDPLLRGDLKKQRDLEEAMKVICPRHENRSGRLILRAGLDKTGHYRYFEALRGREKPADWRRERELNAVQYADLKALQSAGQLRTENGPSWCFLFFHIDENIVPLYRR